MAITVKLKDIIDEMEIQSDFHSSYLNKKTGEIVMVTDDHFQVAEDEDDLSDYPEWEQEAIKLAGEVLGSDDYIVSERKPLFIVILTKGRNFIFHRNLQTDN